MQRDEPEARPSSDPGPTSDARYGSGVRARGPYPSSDPPGYPTPRARRSIATLAAADISSTFLVVSKVSQVPGCRRPNAVLLPRNAQACTPGPRAVLPAIPHPLPSSADRPYPKFRSLGPQSEASDTSICGGAAPGTGRSLTWPGSAAKCLRSMPPTALSETPFPAEVVSTSAPCALPDNGCRIARGRTMGRIRRCPNRSVPRGVVLWDRSTAGVAAHSPYIGVWGRYNDESADYEHDPSHDIDAAVENPCGNNGLPGTCGCKMRVAAGQEDARY